MNEPGTAKEVLLRVADLCDALGWHREGATLRWAAREMLPDALAHLLDGGPKLCHNCGQALRPTARRAYCGDACRMAACRTRARREPVRPACGCERERGAR